MTTQTYRLSIEIISEKAKQAIDALKSKLEELENKSESFSDKYKEIAAVSGVAFGVIAAATVGATKESIKFEKALAGIKKVVDFKAPDGLDKMRTSLEKLSTQIPIPFEELAEIAAAGGQLGVAEDKLLDFTKVTADMATAFDMSAESAGDSMAKLANVFGKPIDQMAEFGDMINTVSNNMPAKASEIVESLTRVGGVGKTFGLTEKQTVALTGAMISLGKAPEVASTGINSMLTTLSTLDVKDKEVSASLKQMGIDTTEFAKRIKTDGYGAIMQLLDGINQLPKDQQIGVVTDLFGKNFGDDIVQLAGAPDVLAKINGLLAEQQNYIGSMKKEAENVSDTTEAKLTKLNNAFSNTKAAVGDAFKPLLNTGIEALTPVLEKITQFAKDNSNLVVGIVVVTGAIAGLVAGIATLGAVVPIVSSGFALLVATFSVISLPVIGIIAGITALIAIGVALYRNWDTIQAKASEVWSGIKQWASDAWQSIVGIWGSLGEWFSNIWSSLTNTVSEVWNSIKTSFSEWLSSMPAPVQEMVENIGSIFDGLVAIASTIWNGLVTVVKWVVDGIVAIWQGFISVISSIWAVIVNVAKTVWNAIVTVVTTVINAIKVVISGVVTVFSLAWQGLVNIATSVWNAIKAVVSLGINNIKAIFTAGVTIFASIFNAGFNAVKTVVSTVFKVIKSLVKGDMEGVKQAFSDGFNKLKSIATKAKDNIVNALKDLGSKLLSAGRDAVQGFINGFTSKMEDAYNKAREMASKVISVVKSALDIHSPSREMKKLGKHTAEGMQVGIDEGKDKAVKAAKKMADDIKKTVADSVANLKREIALFGNDSPVDALAYDIKIGKYKGADTKELEALTMQKYTLERNKVVLDEIDGIKEKIALVGKSELETLKYQLDHADKYKGISDEIKQSYLERTEALNQAIKAQERLSKVEAATADIAKNKHILANWQDKHAGLKYDLGKDGYDASQIEQIVQAEVVKEQVGKLQQLFSDISNKQVFATPQITANLANKGGGFDFASQMFGQSFDIAKKFEEQNALLKASREQGLIEEEVYLKQSEALTQAHVEAKAALMQSATQSVLGGITGIMKNVYGEQSKHYKVAFAMEKAYSVATILMKQKEALAKAWASAPFPANLGAVASTMASTGALAATVNAIRPVGQAHDGIMSVPKSGTWNLEKGERVLPKHTAKALDDKLANMNGAGNNVVITINIDNKGNEQQSSENAGQQAKTLANTIKAVVYETLRSERRQGGLLA